MVALPENAKLYLPKNNETPGAVIQIIHGMAEHQGRYVELADFLSLHGIAAITSDLRGHGKNVKRKEDLGYFGDHAADHLVADVHDITGWVKANLPGVPYFILGHSMGSLIATCYFKKYDNFIDGLFLSGIPGYNSAVGLAKFMIKVEASIRGEYHRSKLINNLCNGPFSKAFPNEGSAFAWLSVDKENVRAYEEDPECGYVFTLNGFFTLMELLEGTYKKGSWIMKNKECPVKLMSGEDDPCMGDKKNFMKSVNMFKDHGYEDVSYVLYPGQRHEIFLDTNKKTAMTDLLMSILNCLP